MILLKECLDALGNSGEVLSESESDNIFDIIQDLYPFTSFGRIDWDKIKNKVILESSKISDGCLPEKDYFIMWDQASLPVVKSPIIKIIKNLDDVLAVSFDTWLLSVDFDCVVEFYHEGEISMVKDYSQY